MSEAEMFQMIADFDQANNGYIRLSQFMPFIVHHEYCRMKGPNDQDLLDAYISMGGEPDGSGCIDA